jgi:Malonate decarboxylase, alpha subunit, transporter/ATP:dephospho-CoA triphosphoribosyl transferase
MRIIVSDWSEKSYRNSRARQDSPLASARRENVPEELYDCGLPEHLTLFELGIAKKVDFSFAGPQALRLAQLLEDGKIEIGAIHTHVELYARLLIDLIPDVVLVCAEAADEEGNLYTGPNTEDTPVIVEAAAFHDGIDAFIGSTLQMAELDDTCLLHRGGEAALRAAKNGAAVVIGAGGAGSSLGQERLRAMDLQLLQLGVSPGGSADL